MADCRFTSTALGAIRLAQENAARLGHSYVGSEHLLLGLPARSTAPPPVCCGRRERAAPACGFVSHSWWAPGCPDAPCTRG